MHSQRSSKKETQEIIQYDGSPVCHLHISVVSGKSLIQFVRSPMHVQRLLILIFRPCRGSKSMHTSEYNKRCLVWIGLGGNIYVIDLVALESAYYGRNER